MISENREGAYSEGRSVISRLVVCETCGGPWNDETTSCDVCGGQTAVRTPPVSSAAKRRDDG